MNVDVAPVPPPSVPPDSTCIVIDVLRATSVIAVLFDRGIERIYPTETIEEARELRDTLARMGTPPLLLGEVNGLAPPGFDAGNSPTAIARLPLESTVAVQATTNGTPALVACRRAALVLAAAPLNAGAATELTLAVGRDVLIVCAGLRGGFAEDDTLAAGLFVERLVRSGARPSGTARSALGRYERASSDLTRALADTEHGRRTVELGFEADIRLCATRDRYQAVAALTQHCGRPALEAATLTTFTGGSGRADAACLERSD